MLPACHSRRRLAPAATRLRGGLHTLAELAATPLAPADYLDLLDPLRSRTDLRARIVSVVPETAGASTVTLRPGRTWRGHRPGQFVRIGVDVDGVRHWRSYSLTSPPDRADGLLTITVQTIPDGLVSGHLVRRAQPGEVVHLEQAAGEFTLPATLPPRRCSSPPAAASPP
jgi:stearoyl-CoA 9-desaturase NADPH oxidoreductase